MAPASVIARGKEEVEGKVEHKRYRLSTMKMLLGLKVRRNDFREIKTPFVSPVGISVVMNSNQRTGSVSKQLLINTKSR